MQRCLQVDCSLVCPPRHLDFDFPSVEGINLDLIMEQKLVQVVSALWEGLNHRGQVLNLLVILLCILSQVFIEVLTLAVLVEVYYVRES